MRTSTAKAVQLVLLILLALLVLTPLLWLVSTSLKGPAEDIFSSPPALLPAQPSLDAYVRLFQDNPLTTYLFKLPLSFFILKEVHAHVPAKIIPVHFGVADVLT